MSVTLIDAAINNGGIMTERRALKKRYREMSLSDLVDEQDRWVGVSASAQSELTRWKASDGLFLRRCAHSKRERAYVRLGFISRELDRRSE